MKIVLFAFVLNIQMAEVTDLYPPMAFETTVECSQMLEEVLPSVHYWRQPGRFDAGALCEPMNVEDIPMVRTSIYEGIRQLVNPFGRRR